MSRLGRGGMGEVYLAEQLSVGTRVAVKLLHADISEDHDHVTRFFNEARAAARIQHAGIVKIFDVGIHEPSGRAYLIMEHLEGESLGRRIRRGRLTLAQVCDVARQMASVLEATHAAGITHRDLKPDNIYLVPDRELPSRERVKVLDFGIAKLTNTLAGNSPKTMGTMGTPAYMAPEQWGDSSKVDWRADLYALGCVTFEMLCGRPPFVAANFAEACAKHLTEPPPSAKAREPSVPDELDRFLLRLLAKDPAERPTSMQNVVGVFDAFAKDAGSAVPFGPTAAVAQLRDTTPTDARPGGTIGTTSRGVVSEDGDTVPSPSRHAPKEPTKKVGKKLALWEIVLCIALVGGALGVTIWFAGHGDKSRPDPSMPVVATVVDAAPDATIDAAPDAAASAGRESIDAVVTALAALDPKFLGCYKQSRRYGTIELAMTIDEHGRPVDVSTTETDASVDACLQKLMSSIEIAPPAAAFQAQYRLEVLPKRPKHQRPTLQRERSPDDSVSDRAGND